MAENEQEQGEPAPKKSWLERETEQYFTIFEAVRKRVLAEGDCFGLVPEDIRQITTHLNMNAHSRGIVIVETEIPKDSPKENTPDESLPTEPGPKDLFPIKKCKVYGNPGFVSFDPKGRVDGELECNKCYFPRKYGSGYQ